MLSRPKYMYKTVPTGSCCWKLEATEPKNTGYVEPVITSVTTRHHDDDDEMNACLLTCMYN